MSTVPDGLYQYGGVPVGGREALGMGKVFFVIQTTAYLYNKPFHTDKLGAYADGKDRVYNTIQGALNACTSLNNDYVVLVPDHLGYTITSTLSFGYKMNVKLLCPAAYSGYDIGCNRLAPITMSTANAPVVTMTGHHCEIAGLTFVNAASTTGSGSAISAAASTGYYSNIHHNLFEMYTSGATNTPIIGNATSGLTWSRIHHNKFIAYSGASTTIAAIINLAANATGLDVDYNYISIGDGMTVTSGITNLSVKGSVKFNTFNAAQAQGGSSAGAFGAAITSAPAVAVIGNRVAGATGTGLAGGTANYNYVDNRDAQAGGETAIET